MERVAAVCAFCVIALAACGRSAPSYYAPGAPPALMRDSVGEQSFIYSHILVMQMARDFIQPRFNRAQDRCLHDAKLQCRLEQSSYTAGDGNQPGSTYAQLVVTLPHDRIADFEKSLLEPLEDEAKDDASVRSRSTQAQNVTQEASDTDRKVMELTAYRDRLSQLLKRSDLRVDDLIKIESELAKVQTDLDSALAQKRDVSDRVARESLSITFGERATLGSAWQPIGQVWRDGMQSLGDSAASALEFLIRAIPWLPILAGAIWLLSWLWRLVRRKRAGSKSA